MFTTWQSDKIKNYVLNFFYIERKWNLLLEELSRPPARKHCSSYHLQSQESAHHKHKRLLSPLAAREQGILVPYTPCTERTKKKYEKNIKSIATFS